MQTLQKFNNLADLGKSFQKWKMSDSIKDRLAVVNLPNTIFANSLREGLMIKDWTNIFKEIKEQAQDHRQKVSDTIGEDLLNDILNF
jgi:hypothetical protein